MVSRNDVTEYFHDGHDYNNSGFYGVISSDYLDFLDNYRIYILYDDGQSIDLIDTKVYLKDK
ncbi:MAG: hypothetical protein SPK04_09125 [Succinivibrionaceae bacterium]|nr:hypothetical protein [Succinivibrionaceae bacterium]